MTPAAIVRGGDALRGLRRMGWFHPEWWVVLAAAGGWGALALRPHGHAAAGEGIAGVAWLAIMAAAMMLPLVLPGVRHVAHAVLWRRRNRAVAVFVMGYLGVWVVVLAVLAQGWRLLTGVAGETGAALCVAAAATLWEVTPARERWLRRCHRTVSLAPSGLRAERDCARLGILRGVSCVGVCWALMLACVAFVHSLTIMTVLFGVQVRGRFQRRPAHFPAALVVATVCLLSLPRVVLRDPPASAPPPHPAAHAVLAPVPHDVHRRVRSAPGPMLADVASHPPGRPVRPGALRYLSGLASGRNRAE